jgi:hypothetical protein
MSAEPKRLFSGAKITLSDRKNRLRANVFEALKCLKSWLKIRDKKAEVLKGLLDSLSDRLISKVYLYGDGESGDNKVDF